MSLSPKDLEGLTPEQKRALLEKLLREKAQQSAKSEEPELKAQPRAQTTPLSLAQEPLWLLHALDPENIANNIPGGVRLTGPLDVTLLEQSFSEVVRRHETLRTAFAEVEGQPAQVVKAAAPVRLLPVDLSSLPEAEREREWRRQADEELRRPFHLGQGSLLRLKLMKLGPQEHVLVLILHQMVADAASSAVLSEELLALYDAFRQGKPSPLAPLPLQYADYSLWQRARLGQSAMLAHLAYWKERLAGAPLRVELPTDRPRKVRPTFAGAELSGRLEAAPLLALKQLAWSEGASLFMVLQATFDLLLMRWSGQDDLSTSTSVSLRNRRELEGLIGLLVNTLVLRLDLSGNPSFRQLLGRTREMLLGAQAHQELPFERVQDEVLRARGAEAASPFQIVFGMRDNPQSGGKLGELDVALIGGHPGVVRSELRWDLYEENQGLVIRVEYASELYEASTVQALLHQFEALLREVSRQPDARIEQLRGLGSGEAPALLRQGRGTLPAQAQENVVSAFQRLAREQGDALAVAWDGGRLSYRELDGLSSALAQRLVKQGVGPEVRVGLSVARGPRMVVGLWGILKAGGAYVPLDPAYPEARLSQMVEVGSVALVVSETEAEDKLPSLTLPPLLLDEVWPALEAEAGSFVAPLLEESLAYVIFTSGSTGQPKGVGVSHAQLARSTAARAAVYPDPPRAHLLTSSLAFDSSVAVLFGTLCRGGTLVLPAPGEEKDIPALARLIETQRVSHVLTLPSVWQLLIDAEASRLSSVKVAVVAGEACSEALVEASARAVPGCALFNEYGPTEGVVWASAVQLETDKPVRIGGPAGHSQLYVLDSELGLLPEGVVGELYLGGALARGYTGRPEATAEVFLPNPFGAPGSRLYRTGDRVRWMQGGQLSFVGRADGQVKVRGFRVELAEVERALLRHPGLSEAVVLTDAVGTQAATRLLAYVVGADGEPAPDTDVLQGFLAERLPEYMVPQSFIELAVLPRLPNGKLDRAALPATQAPRVRGEVRAPRNPTEKALADLFQELLRLPAVGIDDNFFELGGHSLLATQLLSRVKAQRGVELPLRAFFDAPTVESLAQRIAPATVADENLGQGKVFALRDPRWAHERVARWAQEKPEAIALVEGETQLSFAELDRRSNQLAHHLRSLGVGPEVRVGLCLTRSSRMLVGIFGILKAGGAYVPLDPSYPMDRQSYVLNDASVQLVVSEADAEDKLPALAFPPILLDEDEAKLSRLPAQAPHVPVYGEMAAYVIYTSGSTGQPKGVAVSHANLRHLIEAHADFFPNEGIRQLLTFSVAFDGSVFAMFPALCRGGSLVLPAQDEEKDAEALARRIETSAATHFIGVPSLYGALLDAGREEQLASLTLCMVAGEACPPNLVARHRRKLPSAQLFNLYGPTEATVWATGMDTAQARLDADVIPIGRAVANVRVHVLDAALQPVAVGAAGEVYLGGAGVARGYLQRPELTAEAFVPDPFGAPGSRIYRTGDLAKWQADGALSFIGRADGQVKVRGFRIELGEVEAVLMQHPQVREAACVVREDSPGQKRLVAYAQPSEEGLQIEELRSFVAQRLPEHMVPSSWMLLESFPRTPVGKVDRKALPEVEREEAAFIAPRTPTERRLAEIFANVLGVERIGLRDHFFELGGHSLLATQVLGRLREAFQATVSLQRFFEVPTVEQLALLLLEEEGQLAANEPPPLRAQPRLKPPPASFAQERLWFLGQYERGTGIYNMASPLHFRGPLDVDALRRSLAELVRRHESLRTHFRMDEGTLVQVIAPVDQGPRLRELDLSSLPADVREQEAKVLGMEEATRPFDLEQGPLLRMSLLRLGEEEHVVLWTLHHIITDGWSSAILARELFALYGAFKAGRAPSLPALPLQYADFAVWQRQTLTTQALEGHAAYWKRQLSGAAVLELPYDRPRAPLQTFKGTTLFSAVPEGLIPAAQRFAYQEGVTLFMVVEAAFHALLHRYSGQEDISVGAPLAGRNQVEVENVVGFFVNTVVLRVHLSAQQTFQELLQQVRGVTLEALEHQDLPFERVVEVVQPRRDLSRNVLYQAMFNLVNTPASSTALEGLTLKTLDWFPAVAQVDLNLALAENEESHRMEWVVQFNTDLFDASTIQRFVAHLNTLLRAAIARPHTALAHLPLMEKEEREQVVKGFNASEGEWPRQQHAVALFERWAQKTPEAVALEGPSESLSYRALDRWASGVGHALWEAGVRPEGRVALLEERGSSLWTAVLGVFKTGAAYVPLDAAHPPTRLRHVLEDSGAQWVVVSEALRGPLDEAIAQMERPPQVLPREALRQQGTWKAPVLLLSHRLLAYVLFTSGSTGRPKGAMVEVGGMVNHLFAKVQALGLGPSDVVAQTASQCFDISVWQFLVALVVGGRAQVVPDEVAHEPARLLTFLEEKKVTVVEVVPSVLRAVLEQVEAWGAKAPSLSSLRWMVPTGEALPADVCARWFTHYPQVPLVNAYGPTECSDDVTHELLRAPPAGATVAIGKPVLNTQLYVLDERQESVPVGVVGELYVGGEGVGRGYAGHPDRTAEVFVPDNLSGRVGARLYRTGDLGRWRPDGRLEFLGRRDFQVKVRGFRIELGEVEAALRQHPQVRDAVVAAQPGKQGPQLVAWVVAPESLGVAALRAHVGTRLPEYMVPPRILFLAALPLTPNGKVDRKALPAPEATFEDEARPYQAPRTETERQLAKLWEELMSLPRVGVTDHFFELGGHSLLATRLVSRVRESLGRELPLRAVFEAPTLEALALKVDQSTLYLPEGPAPAPVSREGALVPSFAQERLWFLEQMQPGLALYNLPTAWRLKGTLQVKALEQALAHMFERHEVLRTALVLEQGTLVQKILPAPAFQLPVENLSGSADPERTLKERSAEEMARPFDLATGLVLRVNLFKIAPDDHVLLMVAHHVAVDGWSGSVWVNELAALYEAFLAGRPASLPPLALQYADFAQWQRQRLSGPGLQAQIDYWKKQLEGAAPSLTLPSERIRPAVFPYPGGRVQRALPTALVRELQQLASAEGVSLFMVLQAAFDVLLMRVTGQMDFSTGTPVAGRGQKAWEGLIGFFINNLVLRVDLSGNPTFREFLQQVKEVLLGAYAHQELPFEKLVEAVQPVRDLSRAPLFQVVFGLQNLPTARQTLPGLTVSSVNSEVTTEKFDLNVTLVEEEGGLTAYATFAKELYEAPGIEALLRQYEMLLREVVKAPQAHVARLRLLEESEVTGLLQRGRVAQKASSHKTVVSAVAELAQQRGGAVALSWEGGALSYAELDGLAGALAQRLAKMGVGPEVRVGLSVERGPRWVVGVLGILKAGGVYVPLDPHYPEARLLQMVQGAGIAVLVSEEGADEKLPSLAVPPLLLDVEWERLKAEAPGAAAFTGRVLPEALAYVIFTSGSTGEPKGVGVSHASLAASTWAREAVYSRAPEAMLMVINATFDASLAAFFGTLCRGGRLVLPAPGEEKDLFALGRIIASEKVTDIVVVASVWQQLVEAVPEQLKSIQTAVVGGEALRETTVEATARQLPRCALFNEYGPTEAVVWSSVAALKAGKPVRIGGPVGHVELYVLDGAGMLVPEGVAGELHVGGALARGYVDQPELTAQAFVPNPYGTRGSRLYRTGDRVRWSAEGQLVFLGRVDGQVKVRGHRVELSEVEATLLKHPGVGQAVVVPEVEEGQPVMRLLAYVVGSEGEPAPEPLALNQFLSERLPAHAVPQVFISLEALPRLSNGKLDKRALPPPQLEAADLPSRAPRNPVEQVLADIFQDLLHLPSVGIDDNFFDLGGHSLLATQVVLRVRSHFGVPVFAQDVFDHQTVASLAEQVLLRMKGEDTRERATLVPIQPEGSARPLFVVHPSFGDVLVYYALSQALGPTQPVFGLRAPELRGAAPFYSFQARITHYLEVLRSVQPQGPYQLVGFSSGGLHAMEMARQLKAEGQEVSLLMLLDTVPAVPEASPALMKAVPLEADSLDWVLELLSPAQRADLQPRPRSERVEALLNLAKSEGALLPDAKEEALNPPLLALRSVMQELATLQVKPFTGAIHLVIAEQSSQGVDLLSTWQALVQGPLTVHRMAADHETLLRPPQVQALAALLRGLLEGASPRP